MIPRFLWSNPAAEDAGRPYRPAPHNFSAQICLFRGFVFLDFLHEQWIFQNFSIFNPNLGIYFGVNLFFINQSSNYIVLDCDAAILTTMVVP